MHHRLAKSCESVERDRTKNAATVDEVVVPASDASFRNDKESGPCSAMWSTAVRRMVSRKVELATTAPYLRDMTSSSFSLTVSGRVGTFPL